MALNILPLRVPIGRVTDSLGQHRDVLMTTEFSRALSDMFDRVGGPNGMSNTELADLIKQLEQQTESLVQQIQQISVLTAALTQAINDVGVIQAVTPEYRPPDDRSGALAMLSFDAQPAGVAQQLADLMVMLSFPDKPAIQKNTVTGAKAGNAALTSLLLALAKSGIITDSTT